MMRLTAKIFDIALHGLVFGLSLVSSCFGLVIVKTPTTTSIKVKTYNLQAASYKRRLAIDKTCKKSGKTCTSLSALISIGGLLCVYNIMQKLATCSQSQRTVQSMVSAAC